MLIKACYHIYLIELHIHTRNGKDLWNPEDGDSPKEKKHKLAKKSHKDVDARWTKKRGENHYGYKNHVKADKKTKLIEKIEGARKRMKVVSERQVKL